MKNSNVVKDYLKEIKKNLKIKKSIKKVFIQELKESIYCFAKDKGTVTTDELYSEFGEPQKIAESFLDRSDYNDLLKKANRRTVICFIIGIVALTLLLWAISIILLLIDEFGGTVYVTGVY